MVATNCGMWGGIVEARYPAGKSPQAEPPGGRMREDTHLGMRPCTTATYSLLTTHHSFRTACSVQRKALPRLLIKIISPQNRRQQMCAEDLLTYGLLVQKKVNY